MVPCVVVDPVVPWLLSVEVPLAVPLLVEDEVSPLEVPVSLPEPVAPLDDPSVEAPPVPVAFLDEESSEELEFDELVVVEESAESEDSDAESPEDDEGVLDEDPSEDFAVSEEVVDAGFAPMPCPVVATSIIPAVRRTARKAEAIDTAMTLRCVFILRLLAALSRSTSLPIGFPDREFKRAVESSVRLEGDMCCSSATVSFSSSPPRRSRNFSAEAARKCL